MMQIIFPFVWFFVAILFAGCSQSRILDKAEFLVKFENSNSGEVVIMSQFSSLESKKLISEIMGVTDVEGRVIFKDLPVPSAYRIYLLKDNEKKYLVGYMLGKDAPKQNHELIIRKDGGTTGSFTNKN